MTQPIPMILHCPRCHVQHIDVATEKWANPPHTRHQCQCCGHEWTPCLLQTTGVSELVSDKKYPPRYAADFYPLVELESTRVRNVPVLADALGMVLPGDSRQLAPGVAAIMLAPSRSWIKAPSGDDWLYFDIPFVGRLRVTRSL